MLLSFDYSRVIAALEDRIRYFIENSSVPEESVRFLSKCDPTGGKYLGYLVSQRTKGLLVDRDDDSICRAVQHALEFYIMVTQSKKIKEHIREIFPELDIPSEIFQIDFKDLRRLSAKYYGNVERIINRFKKKINYTKVIYQDDTYKIIMFTWDPSMSWDDFIDEVCAYGKGKWCTQHRSEAEDYLQAAGGLYIVFKDGKSLLQTDRDQFRDVLNHNFNFFKYPDLAIILVKTGIIKLRKKTPGNPNPNKELLGKLNYYMSFVTVPVKQYLQENDFM